MGCRPDAAGAAAGRRPYRRTGRRPRAWVAYEDALASGQDPAPAGARGGPAALGALVRCALADWPRADRRLDALLAGGPSWPAVTATEQDLGHPAGCPWADRGPAHRPARPGARRPPPHGAGRAATSVNYPPGHGGVGPCSPPGGAPDDELHWESDELLSPLGEM